MEAPSSCVVTLFGTLLFVFGVLPFYGEASAIEFLGSIDAAYLNKTCATMAAAADKMNTTQLMFSTDATRRNMKYLALVYGTAAKFDNLAEKVLD